VLTSVRASALGRNRYANDWAIFVSEAVYLKVRVPPALFWWW